MFSSQWKTEGQFEDVVDEWNKSIGQYPYVKLEAAIERCKKEHKKAPSLPEFMECLTQTQQQALNSGAYNKPNNRQELPPPIGYKMDWRDAERMKFLNAHPEFKIIPKSKQDKHDTIAMLLKFMNNTGTKLPYNKNERLAG